MVKVAEVMTRNVASVSPSDPVVEVARKMRDSGLGMIPVCENGKLRGVVTEKSIIFKTVAFANNPKKERAASLMSNGTVKISPGADIADAAKAMASHCVHYLPVVQNGKLMGLLTLDNLVKESLVMASMVLANSTRNG